MEKNNFNYQAIDPSILDDLAMLDSEPGQEAESEILKELIPMFIKNASAQIQTIKKHAELSEKIPLQKTAHSLKSSAGTVGALELSRQCAELEKLEMLLGTQELIIKLEKEFSAVEKELIEYRKIKNK